MKVNEEKNASIIIVRFETSTSPSWKDIKKSISKIFSKNTNIKANVFNTINCLKESIFQILIYKKQIILIP